MNKRLKIIIGFVILIIAIYIGREIYLGYNNASIMKEKEHNPKVIVAYSQNYVPMDFTNKDGNPDGYEVSVMQKIDETLTDYSFSFVPASDEDMLIGLQTGKYTVGIKGAWKTPERSASYLITDEPIGASIIGISYLNKFKGKFNTLEDFAKNSGKLVPIPPTSAQYSVVEDFNSEHPDSTISLIPSDTYVDDYAYKWLSEGRYDAFFDLKLSFEEHSKSDLKKFSYSSFKGIPTYPLIHLSPANGELKQAIDKTLVELKANGTLTKLSNKFFHEDIFSNLQS